MNFYAKSNITNNADFFIKFCMANMHSVILPTVMHSYKNQNAKLNRYISNIWEEIEMFVQNSRCIAGFFVCKL